jgi:two-component system, NtrC family, sensor kinase
MPNAFRIMLVEDSATQAFKLRVLLEEQGWEVSVAGSAEAALAELSDPLPDLILCDYNLPGMRGDEFCRRIRMNANMRGTAILMMTAAAPETAEIRNLEGDADGYVSKLEGSETLLLRMRALLRQAPARRPIPAPQDAAASSVRILAIDDSPTYRAFLGTELADRGYEIETASSGVEGLSRLAAEKFDCVLVDLAMSEMDGAEVCRRIAATSESLNSGVAVVMLTGCAKPGDLNRGLAAGADDFVSKSNDLTVLKARIGALMRRKSAREVEVSHDRAEREISDSRLAMAEKLVQANYDLREASRKLKETQGHLIQNEKMASLGQLVAGIAHEINNPLAFVVNNLFIVESGLERLGPEMERSLSEPSFQRLQKARTRLEEMREGLDRVKELVLDLRRFSRMDEEKFERVNVAETIDAVLLLMKHKLTGRIVVEKYYVGDQILICSVGRLHQVIMNLISNALDAILEKGTIVITTGRTPEAFLISIRDTGAGIPEEIRGKIFDPFFTTKPIGQGTGLGLAISYGIVQDHGGSIEVQSKEGVGTEFIVKIPLDLELERGK